MKYNKVIFLLLSLSSAASFADATYVKTTYAFDPSPMHDYSKCTEIESAYLQEQLLFNKLSRQLQDLIHLPDAASYAVEISRLKTEVEVHTERLISLARPEWNSENSEIALNWRMPGNDFFPDPTTTRNGYLKKNGKFKQVILNDVYLMGERRPDLKNQVAIQTLNWPYNVVEVLFGKPATFLEFCQFVRTIEINIDVKYEWGSGGPYGREPGIPVTKSLKLIFGEF